MARLISEHKGITFENACILIDQCTQCNDEFEYEWCKSCIRASFEQEVYNKLRDIAHKERWWRK